MDKINDDKVSYKFSKELCTPDITKKHLFKILCLSALEGDKYHHAIQLYLL